MDCRYIFLMKHDEKSQDLIFHWIKNLLPKEDAESKSKEERKERLLRWIPVNQDFTQVLCPPSLCQWMDIETLTQHIEERTHLGTENTQAQNLEAYLHDTADSFPCIGSSVQLYIFLHERNLDSEDSFIPLAGVFLRLIKWHHLRTVFVNMESELSVLAHQLVSLTDGQRVSMTDCPQSTSVSWSGEISVNDLVTKEGVVFPGFYIHSSKWEEVLKHRHLSSPVKQTRRKRGRREQTDAIATPHHHHHPPNPIVCSHSMEVLQEVDLRTFPLYMLTPWTFDLHSFCTSSNNNHKLVEYLYEKSCTGLIARLGVYQMSGSVPECGETSHMSTFAWREHVIGAPTPSSSSSSASLSHGADIDRHHIPPRLEYLHLLILPCPGTISSSSSSSPSSSSSSSTKTPSTGSLRVRVLLTAHEVAKNILSVVSQQESSLDRRGGGMKDSQNNSSSKQKRGGGRRGEEGNDLDEWINSLPVFKVEDFFSTLNVIGKCQDQANWNFKTDKQDTERDEWLESKASQIEQALVDLSNGGHTMGDVLERVGHKHLGSGDWNSEAVCDFSKCPEWIALMADDPNGSSLKLDSSFGRGPSLKSDSSFGSESSSTMVSRKKSLEKTGSKEFSMDHVISLFKEDNPSGQQTKSHGNPFRQMSSDSSVDETHTDQWLKRLDMYHYHSEKDFDSETKYAQIRDQGSFQATQSSFMTPQKKSNRQFRAVVPTRSSPRSTKLFSRKQSSSRTPPKVSGQTKSTFKHPQSLLNSSSSIQRKRPASCLTSETPEYSHSQSSQSSSTTRHHNKKRPISSLTPDSELRRPLKFSRTSTPTSTPSPTPLSSSTPVSSVESAGDASSSWSSQSSYKRVPFTTVLDPVRRSPRKLPGSQSVFGKLVGASKPVESRQKTEDPSQEAKKIKESTPIDNSGKMKRSERHMMRLKGIIARVLIEKGVGKEDPIYQACSKNLLNVSIVLLRTLPNSQNLTDEMKSVVYGQVQQIINLEKRRSGIAL